jgi:hypothetical protein
MQRTDLLILGSHGGSVLMLVLLLNLCTVWMEVMFRTSIFRVKMMVTIHVYVAFGPIDLRRNSVVSAVPICPDCTPAPHSFSKYVGRKPIHTVNQNDWSGFKRS